MKITALVENTTKTDFPTEHGLSLFIETRNHRILFDTGQSALFAQNAERLGVDLKKADICILSHGHYDHGGGLKEFTRINDSARIYMSRNAFGLHYHGEERYIGLNQEWLSDKDFQDRIVYVDGALKLDEGLTICVPGKSKSIDMGSAGQCVKENGRFVPEDFRHEQYLLAEEEGRRILISGCSHQGIINIMNWFSPDVLVGGFHFMRHELDKVLLGYGKMLAKYDTEYYTCHCTGVKQYEFLRPCISRMHYLFEGETITI